MGVEDPKELLPLGGKPLIAYALEEAHRAGFESAIVVVSPSKSSLIRHLEESLLPLPVEIVVQPQPHGIGDALLRSWQGSAVGILLPDDVVLDTEHWTGLLDSHKGTGAATLCVRPVPAETIGRFGIAECNEDRVVRLVEKPSPGTTHSNLAIFGRYIATESVIEALESTSPQGELELTYGFAGAIGLDAGVRAVRFAGTSYDCGTPAEYGRSVKNFDLWISTKPSS